MAIVNKGTIIMCIFAVILVFVIIWLIKSHNNMAALKKITHNRPITIKYIKENANDILKIFKENENDMQSETVKNIHDLINDIVNSAMVIENYDLRQTQILYAKVIKLENMMKLESATPTIKISDHGKMTHAVVDLKGRIINLQRLINMKID